MKELTVEIIHRAVTGDKEALLKILQDYEHYINKYAMVTKITPDGKIHHYVDEDQKAEIQKQKTVFEFDRIKNSKEDGCGHPSSKPVPLIAYLIQQCTQSNGLVLDGFLGSASTLIACEQLDRICYGIELEPKFVDVAVERFRKYISESGRNADIFVIRDGQRIDYADVPKEEAQHDQA